jgi:hypothetical protein
MPLSVSFLKDRQSGGIMFYQGIFSFLLWLFPLYGGGNGGNQHANNSCTIEADAVKQHIHKRRGAAGYKIKLNNPFVDKRHKNTAKQRNKPKL